MKDKTFYSCCSVSLGTAHSERDSVRLFVIGRFFLDLLLIKEKNAYQYYLKYPHWKDIRHLLLERQNFCEKCKSEYELEIHHLNYNCLFAEKPKDLRVLCNSCHTSLHERQKAEKLQYARVDGWASKVYGEDWQERLDGEQVEEEFNEWLEEHQYN